jgi:HD-like signal output (HDOD) protein
MKKMKPSDESESRRNKRIMFVDDEPALLQLYEAMLESMHGQWDLTFVDNGRKALSLMEKTPCDVLVSDMRMPGMSGAELLIQVMQHYPKTARIVLSGYSDQQDTLKSVGAIHQWLSKPCDIKTIKSTIMRVATLDRDLNNKELVEVLSKMNSLPSLPAFYFQILKECQDPDSTIERIASIISQDFGLLAKLLQLVNSAFFGFSRTVSSAAEAVQLLGVSTIRTLALTVHVFSCFEEKHFGGFSIEQLWTHSFGTASMARKIVELEDGDEQMLESAFTAGLLHDVGKLLLLTNQPTTYRKMLSLAEAEQIPEWQAEHELFGTTHAEVGGYLLGLWGLPVSIVEAIAWHHCPSKSMLPTISALTAVHVANTLQRDRNSATSKIPASKIQTDYIAKLGLLERLDVWHQVRDVEKV